MSVRLAPGLRPLSSREERLDVLLCNYTDCQDSGFAERNGGHERGDSRLMQMPNVWNVSYRELERVLDRMASLAGYARRTVAAAPAGTASPGHKARYVHLCRWYFAARRKRVPVLRYDSGKRKHYQVEREGEPQWRVETVRGGDARFVLKGVEWVDAEFVGEVWLPDELLAAA